MISEAKLGWMAAVLELRSAVVRKANKMRATPQLVLRVESTNIAVVNELCRLTGTKVDPHDGRSLKDWMQRGCIQHCPEAHVHHLEQRVPPQSSIWTITGAGAAVVLHNLMPYLVSANEDLAALMDEATENMVLTGQGSGQVRKAILRLSRLGWELPPVMLEKLVPVEEAGKDTQGTRSRAS